MKIELLVLAFCLVAGAIVLWCIYRPKPVDLTLMGKSESDWYEALRDPESTESAFDELISPLSGEDISQAKTAMLILLMSQFYLKTKIQLSSNQKQKASTLLRGIVKQRRKMPDTNFAVLQPEAIKLLGDFEGAKAIPDLIYVLENGQSSSALLNSIGCLANLGKEAAQAIPALEQIRDGGSIFTKPDVHFPKLRKSIMKSAEQALQKIKSGA